MFPRMRVPAPVEVEAGSDLAPLLFEARQRMADAGNAHRTKAGHCHPTSDETALPKASYSHGINQQARDNSRLIEGVRGRASADRARDDLLREGDERDRVRKRCSS